LETLPKIRDGSKIINSVTVTTPAPTANTNAIPTKLNTENCATLNAEAVV
jgi:hypothetical protein